MPATDPAGRTNQGDRQMNHDTTATTHLMVVEHDAPTRELLCDHLEAEEFKVEAADGLDQARTSLAALDLDLVLLDLTLPDGQAMTLLEEIHEQNPEMGLIVVSGRGTERDRVGALANGADDYIQKPFTFGELLVRVNAVLRRRQGSSPTINIGALEINTVEKTVTVSGRDVHLSEKEFELLTVMAAEPSRVFSKEELLREVWGYRSAGHNRTLEVLCSSLRRKLDPDHAIDPDHARYVVRCWGVGYRLSAPGTGIRDDGAAAKSSETPSDGDPTTNAVQAVVLIARLLPKKDMWRSAADFMEATAGILDRYGIPRPDHYEH
ncbi:MAG: response regulator transcription factor [Solirubrobacterales bacterium]|nr:response regulator transcription factor [Solirubrobacterales bacterium]